MVGSKQRATIQGNIVMADPAVVQLLRRIPAETLRPIFQQARDHGSSPLMIADAQYFMNRQSDHTFRCEPGINHRVAL